MNLVSWGRGLGFAGLVTLLSVTPVLAYTVGTGQASTDFDLSAGFPAPIVSGSVVWDNTPRLVGSVTVNLGAAGTSTIAGSIDTVDPTTPISGAIHGATSAGGLLSTTFNVNYVCSATGCVDGSLVSLVGAANVSGSLVAGLTPLNLVYTTDSSARCCVGGACNPALGGNIQRCTGVFALNGFEQQNTPAGSSQTTPLTGTFFDPFTNQLRSFSGDVTFDQVNGPGATVVKGISNAPGNLPENFEFSVGGLFALFFDVTSTAAYQGTITLCVDYPDSQPSDGIVDGTTVSENAIVLYHLEGGSFVAKPTHIDPVANKACINVTSLSPFIMSASNAGFVPPNRTSLACEDKLAANVGKLAGAVAKCNLKGAHNAFVGKSDGFRTCEQAAIDKYNQANAKLFGCPVCLGTSATDVGNQVLAALDGSGAQMYCDGTVPFGF